MSFTKTDLRQYTEGVLRVRRNAMETAFKQAVHAKLDPVLDDVQNLLQELSKKLGEAHTHMHTLKLDNPLFQHDWDFANKMRNVEHAYDYMKRIKRSNLFNDAMNLIRMRHTDNVSLGSEELNKAVEELRVELADQRKALNDLSILENEVEAVIKASSTAKRAGEALQELGFDMTGFDFNPPVTKALAIQNFSVDVRALLANSKEA